MMDVNPAWRARLANKFVKVAEQIVKYYSTILNRQVD